MTDLQMVESNDDDWTPEAAVDPSLKKKQSRVPRGYQASILYLHAHML